MYSTCIHTKLDSDEKNGIDFSFIMYSTYIIVANNIRIKITFKMATISFSTFCRIHMLIYWQPLQDGPE